MRTMGKFAPGLYLLAPAITFTLVPDLALTLHNNGSTASSVLGVSWLVLFFVTLVVAALFHFVVELPSKMLGEIVCEMLESSEPTPLVGEVKQAGGKLLKKNVGGGANKGAAPAAGSKPVLV